MKTKEKATHLNAMVTELIKTIDALEKTAPLGVWEHVTEAYFHAEIVRAALYAADRAASRAHKTPARK